MARLDGGASGVWLEIVTERLAVVGDPIEHSRSPQLHLAAYRELGLDWSYERMRVQAGQLEEFVNSLDESWRGLSVTMPLKPEARSLCHHVDENSIVTGGTNTLLLGGQSSVDTPAGFNTDVAGIREPLRRLGCDSISHATLVGAGSSAASALVALSELGCVRVHVVVRNLDRVQEITSCAERLGVQLTCHSLDTLDKVPVTPVTISTVPASASLSFGKREVTPGDVLFDIAYGASNEPDPSNWMARGGRVVGGLSMLAEQALQQVRVFVNGDPILALPDEERVRSKMYAAVGLDESGLSVRSVG